LAARHGDREGRVEDHQVTSTGKTQNREAAAAPPEHEAGAGRWARSPDARLMLILFAVAVLLYVPAIWWGVPDANGPARVRTWNSDELGPLGPIGEMYSVFVRRGPPFNPQYPLFHYLVQALVVGPYWALLWLTGGLREPAATYPFGLSDPREALVVSTILARAVSIVMGAGVVAIAYRTGTILRDRATGIAAAILVLFIYPIVYYARTSNVDVPALFWTALGLALFARYLRSGLTARRVAVLGAVSALAVATKDASYAPLALAAALLLVREWRARPDAAGARRTLAFGGIGLASLLAVYLPASGMIFHFGRYLRHIRFITEGSPQRRGSLYYFSTPASIDGYLSLLGKTAMHLVESLGAPVTALAVAGLALAAFRARGFLLFALPALGVLAVVLPVRFVLLRFTMPTAYILAFFAAYAAVEGARAAAPRVRAIARIAFAAVCAWSFLRAADLTGQMLFDTRYQTEAWLAERLDPGEAVGYIGAATALPRLPADNPTVPVFGPDRTDLTPRFVVVPLLTYRNRDILPAAAARTPPAIAIAGGLPGYEPVRRFEPRTLFRTRPIASLNPLVVVFERRAGGSS
jgi:hypothetical protein